MKKIIGLLYFVGFFLGLSAQQNSGDIIRPSKEKIRLFYPNEAYFSEQDKVSVGALKIEGLKKKINWNSSNVLMLENLNATTLFFLNQWWNSDHLQDSILYQYVGKCLYPFWDNDALYYRDNSYDFIVLPGGIALESLKNWRNQLTINQRSKIRFHSFMSSQPLVATKHSVVFYIDYLLSKLKGLDVETQSHIEAIESEKEIIELRIDDFNKRKNGSSSVSVDEATNDVISYGYAGENFTVPSFFRNIQHIDSVVFPNLDVQYKEYWRKFVQEVKFMNLVNAVRYYYSEDFQSWESKLKLKNQHLIELNQITQDTFSYYFILNKEEFDVLKLSKNIEEESASLGLYQTIKEIFPSTPVQRFMITVEKIVVDSGVIELNTDSLSVERELDLNDTSNIEIVYVRLDSLAQKTLIEKIDHSDDSGRNEDAAMAEPVVEYYGVKSKFGLESSYSRFYNDIDEMLKIIQPIGDQMQHISFVGGAFFFQDKRGAGNLNTYRFGYQQTYGKESLDEFWGHTFGLQMDVGLYDSRFFGLSISTNYAYGDFTYTKSPLVADAFLTNPTKLYQIENSFFNVGTGLHLKLKLSELTFRASGGYQWDLTDGRWTLNGNFINSLGKMKTTGGFFEIGVGLNLGEL